MEPSINGDKFVIFLEVRTFADLLALLSTLNFVEELKQPKLQHHNPINVIFQNVNFSATRNTQKMDLVRFSFF